MKVALFVVLCLALPWIWGAILAAFYARRDRRPAAEPPPSRPDYMI